MIPIEKTIIDLIKTDRARRDFDDAIGEILGWTKAFSETLDANTGKPVKKQLPKWHPPGKETTERVPDFTTNFDQAMNLASQVANGDQVVVSWDKYSATAVIGTDRPMQAVSPMLAICAAALMRLRRQQTPIEKTQG